MTQRNKFKIFNELDCVWSTQKLIDRYEGPGIRIRRSSDNFERDIFFDGGAGSWLNIQMIIEFVGAGNDAYVVRVYDQNNNKRNFQCVETSGVANSEETDLYQDNASNQPLIVLLGALNTDKNGRPCIAGNNASNNIRFKMARTLVEATSLWNGVRMCLNSPPTTDAYSFYTNQTSQRHRLFVESSSQLYKIITTARPDTMQGTDANYYYCTGDSSASASNEPTTGGSWPTFWSPLPVGNSPTPLFDYTQAGIDGYNSQDFTNYHNCPYVNAITTDTSILSTSTYNIEQDKYSLDSIQDYGTKESSIDNESPKTGYAFDTSTGLCTDTTPAFSTTPLGRFGERLEGYTHMFFSYRTNNAYYPSLFEQVQMAIEVA